MNRPVSGFKRMSNVTRSFARSTLAMVMALIWGVSAVQAANLPDNLLIEKGREVFLTAGGVGCAACHGPYAEGDVGIGPYNRGFKEAAIVAAINSVEAMEFLREEMTNSQIKQIAAYYEWLGQLKLVKTLAKRGRFIPNRVEVYPGDKIQLVVNNASTQPHNFTSDNLGLGKITVPGRENMDVVWESPATEGTFTLACADCTVKGQMLTIEVTKSAKKYIPPTLTPKVMAKVTPAPAATATAKKPAAPARIDMAAVEKGRQLFLNVGDVGCVACHGRYAEGDVGIGPYNRGFSETAIRRALMGAGPMSFLRKEMTGPRIKEVAAYYEYLSHIQLVKALVVRGLFVPEKVSVRPGQQIQLVVINSSRVPRIFAGKDMGIADFAVAGRDASDIVWTAPESEGTHKLTCADCPIRGQALTIEVTSGAPPYVPPVALK